jgi:hypothetical protein
MPFPNDRTYSFDANLQLSDNANAYTATGYLQVAGADALLDLGGNQGTTPVQNARIDAMAVFDVTAVKTTTGNETYQLDIVLSNDPAFGSNVAIAAGIQLGAAAGQRQLNEFVSVTGRYEIGFTNQLAGNIYQYAKVYLTAAGTTPSISIEAFVAVLPEP